MFIKEQTKFTIYRGKYRNYWLSNNEQITFNFLIV